MHKRYEAHMQDEQRSYADLPQDGPICRNTERTLAPKQNVFSAVFEELTSRSLTSARMLMKVTLTPLLMAITIVEDAPPS